MTDQHIAVLSDEQLIATTHGKIDTDWMVSPDRAEEIVKRWEALRAQHQRLVEAGERLIERWDKWGDNRSLTPPLDLPEELRQMIQQEHEP